jgi:acyl-CoA thioesterase YciA
MITENNLPRGQLLLRTLAMPADTNANGDIFGGWIMSQLDLAGAILAKEISRGRVVTVSVAVAVDGIGERYRVCEATFNYVAINSEGRPRKIEVVQ